MTLKRKGTDYEDKFCNEYTLKFDIARAYFKPLGSDFVLEQLTIDVPEVQADTAEEVATHSALMAARQVGEPYIVTDAGLWIDALNGFPGPFVKYANEWLGADGYLRLLSGAISRRAHWEDTLAVAFPDGSTKVFVRKEYGTFAESVDPASSGWAANNLFIPDGHTAPLGQLTHEEQVAFWGDGRWPDMVEFLKNSFPEN